MIEIRQGSEPGLYVGQVKLGFGIKSCLGLWASGFRAQGPRFFFLGLSATLRLQEVCCMENVFAKVAFAGHHFHQHFFFSGLVEFMLAV